MVKKSKGEEKKKEPDKKKPKEKKRKKSTRGQTENKKKINQSQNVCNISLLTKCLNAYQVVSLTGTFSSSSIF